MYTLSDHPQEVSQQKLMEAGNRANNSGVKPIQEAARPLDKRQYYSLMKVKLLKSKQLLITHEDKSGDLQVLCKS